MAWHIIITQEKVIVCGLGMKWLTQVCSVALIVVYQVVLVVTRIAVGSSALGTVVACHLCHFCTCRCISLHPSFSLAVLVTASQVVCTSCTSCVECRLTPRLWSLTKFY